MKPDAKNLNNSQIVALALYLAGGKTISIHLEDVAVFADKIRPGRYRWEKFKEHISDRIILNSLSDASKEKNGPLVIGGIEKGWMLTPIGLCFVEKNMSILKDINKKRLSEPRLTPEQRSWLKHEKMRLMKEEAIQKYKKDKNSKIDIREAESVFRLNDYITGKARKTQIHQLLNHFSNDDELSHALVHLGKILLEGANESKN